MQVNPFPGQWKLTTLLRLGIDMGSTAFLHPLMGCLHRLRPGISPSEEFLLRSQGPIGFGLSGVLGLFRAFRRCSFLKGQ
jgi:hypothetical protein